MRYPYNYRYAMPVDPRVLQEDFESDGLDTIDANLALGHEIDERDFGDAVEILNKLGLVSVTLLTNNPMKAQALSDAAIVTKVRDLATSPNPFNLKYLETKRRRLGHGG